MVNALPLRIHLSGQIFGWSDEQKALVKEAIDCYKATRDGISEAIPFYPLGVPQYSDKNFCSAYRIADRIRLAVWRLDGGCESLFIPIGDSNTRTPKILFPSDSESRVESVNGGINVILPEPGSAVYIEL
jgi:alpha-galactosidase